MYAMNRIHSFRHILSSFRAQMFIIPILVVYVILGHPLYSSDLYLSVMGFTIVKVALVDRMFMFELLAVDLKISLKRMRVRVRVQG